MVPKRKAFVKKTLVQIQVENVDLLENFDIGCTSSVPFLRSKKNFIVEVNKVKVKRDGIRWST